MISRAFARASASGKIKLARGVAVDISSARSRGRICYFSKGCRCWIPKTLKVNGLLPVLPDDHKFDDGRKTGHPSRCGGGEWQRYFALFATAAARIAVRELRAPLCGRYRICFSPGITARDYLDSFGNICTRLVAPPGLLEIRNRFIICDGGQPDEVAFEARQWEVDDLPDEALVFLLESRYCGTEKLSNLAWSLFGEINGGWQRVQAICDYVHDRLQFGYPHARCDRTAGEGHEERIGVCRDFAHLAVTLCRCMNIPARYCTGYLGDIGVPRDPAPMDFSAWFEVFLGGRWFTFDARHNHPRIGRIVVARGRDAADVTISTAFGSSYLAKFTVLTEELSDKKMTSPGLVPTAKSLDAMPLLQRA